jgi:lysophospholipase L1-like esterase
MRQEVNRAIARLMMLLFLVLTFTANAQIKIATVGDSITQGMPYYNSSGNGCTNCGGYQPKLELLIDAESWSAGTVYNYGIGDEWSDEGAARIPGIISSINPDYVMFMEGTNDLQFSIAPSTVSARVEIAVNNTIAGGKIPIIGTILPDTRGSSNTAKQIPLTNDLIRAMLVVKEVQLAELYYATSYSGWVSLMSDGVHPNQAGYQLMADTWYAAMLEINGKSSLTIIKDVINDHGGNATADEFVLRVSGVGYDGSVPRSSGDWISVDANTAYTLSEDEFPGYTQKDITCKDGVTTVTLIHPVTLAEGQSAICTITNLDYISVFYVIPLPGGGAAVFDL